MYIVNYYVINPNMYYMTGEFDRNGKLCTKVVEEDKTFLVDKSPLEVVKDSIRYIGSEFRGALSGAQHIIGPRRMCPIIVNFHLGICIFPDRAYRSPDCIWFNSCQIARTTALYLQTQVYFKNGDSLTVNARLSSFNTKVQNAEQLRKLTYERGMNVMSTVLDPTTRKPTNTATPKSPKVVQRK